MKYLVKTITINGEEKIDARKDSVNKKKSIYCVKSENGQVLTVDKEWLKVHKEDLVNVGISGESLYLKAYKKSKNANEERVNRVVYDIVPLSVLKKFKELLENFFENILITDRVEVELPVGLFQVKTTNKNLNDYIAGASFTVTAYVKSTINKETLIKELHRWDIFADVKIDDYYGSFRAYVKPTWQDIRNSYKDCGLKIPYWLETNI